MGIQASEQVTLSSSPLEILQQLGKTFKIAQRPRTCQPSYRLFSGSSSSSWEQLPDETVAPRSGLEAHAAAHQLCSGAGSRTAIQPSAGEANWLCPWTSSSTRLSCVSIQALGNTSAEVWAPCSSTGYGHAMVYPRQEVFSSSDNTPALRDEGNHGAVGEGKSAAQLLPCANHWQLIRWLMSHQAS